MGCLSAGARAASGPSRFTVCAHSVCAAGPTGSVWLGPASEARVADRAAGQPLPREKAR